MSRLVSTDDLCRVRTARKRYRCTCADEHVGWVVVSERLPTISNRHTRYPTREAAEGYARVAPDEGYTVLGIEPLPNPDHRSSCRVDIFKGDQHVEYLGEAAAYSSGVRYCSSCAVATWDGVAEVEDTDPWEAECRPWISLCERAMCAPDTQLTDTEVAARVTRYGRAGISEEAWTTEEGVRGVRERYEAWQRAHRGDGHTVATIRLPGVE